MNELRKTFNSFSNQKIFIIGDIMIDSYMWGNVERISPEAPVPVVSVESKENRLGGAANVGLNIRALGAEAVLCAMIGEDDKGAEFRQLLQKRNLSDRGLLQSKTRTTTVKTRVIASSQQLIRVDEEKNEPLNHNQALEFIKHTKKLITNEKPNAIIFEDYDKGNITPKVIEQIVETANKWKIPVLVDPKKRNFFAYNHVTLFKPNFKELTEGMKISMDKRNLDAIKEAATKLIKKISAQYVMITLSEAGVMLLNENETFTMPAQKREIADVSGAGDTVISVLGCCMAAGINTQTSTIIANIAGGQVCEKVGVVPVDKTILLEETNNYFNSSQN